MLRLTRLPGVEHSDRCPISTIFITAHGDEKMRLQAMRAGAAKFLAKAFDDGALRDVDGIAMDLLFGHDLAQLQIFRAPTLFDQARGNPRSVRACPNDRRACVE